MRTTPNTPITWSRNRGMSDEASKRRSLCGVRDITRGRDASPIAAMPRAVGDTIESHTRSDDKKTKGGNRTVHRSKGEGATHHGLGDLRSRAMVSRESEALDPVAARSPMRSRHLITTQRDTRYDCDNFDGYPKGLKQN
jgi:hypothetical protein